MPQNPQSGALGSRSINSDTSTAWAKRWSESYRDAPAEDVLRWLSVRFKERAAVVTSFQAEGMVVLDLLDKLDLGLRVLTVDTGRLPDETYQQIERVRERYGIDVEVVMPEHSEVSKLVSEHGPDFFKSSAEMRLRCCFVRKIAPFQKAVEGLDCWVAGLRRDQGGPRRYASRIEVDLANRPVGTLFKVSPLLDWSEERVWSYIRDNDVPYHPLYDRGYRSIGCAPCTRPSLPGEGAREARWWWESGPRECGLHFSNVEEHSFEEHSVGRPSVETISLGTPRTNSQRALATGGSS